MRKNKFLTAGITFLAIALLLLRAHMRSQQLRQASQDSAIQRDVVMARQTIPKWTVITPEMIELRKINAQDKIPSDAMASLDQVQGKVTRAEVMPGRPIAGGELLTQQELGLSAQLPPGRRAMTIQVTDTTSVAGFLRPGDRVDVLGTFTGESPVTETLLQAVQVIAVGKNLDQKPLNAADPKDLVTVAVSSREAEALTFAQSKATLHLVLLPLAERPESIEPPVPVDIRPAPAPHSSRTRVVRRAPVRRVARHDHRAAPTPTLNIAPPFLPPARPETLIYPIPPPVPARPSAARQVREGPAQPAAVPPQRTVEVIRGTQRETVVLRATESKVIKNEPVQDQR